MKKKEKGLVLNTHQFWEEKIYIDDVKQGRDRSNNKVASNTIPEYLSDLLDDFDIDKIDKYFNRKNLPDQARNRLRLGVCISTAKCSFTKVSSLR